MAHKSTENLIQSDSSISTDETNKKSHSHSVEKVSKKIFLKKKTAFVGVNSVTSPSSSVTSSPQQHPIIVVGTVDVHQSNLSPPKPLPRKRLMTASVQSAPMLNKSEEITTNVAKENIELFEIRSPSRSSGDHSDKTEEPNIFFARSRKNTIVTNIDEISVKSSRRSSISSHSPVLNSDGYSKPLPKPRQHFQSRYEIIDETQLHKPNEEPERKSVNDESLHSKQLNSESETLTDGVDSEFQRNAEEKTVLDKGKIDSIRCEKDNSKLIGIYIHSSSELKYDYNVHRPMVRCSIMDATTGQLLRRNNKSKGNSKKEIPLEDAIQPLMTKGCSFTSSNKFECQWEELLILNENITQIMRGNEILFLEILDAPSTETKNIFRKFSEDNEWHHVCWGFLRPGDGISYSNVDKRSSIQLYRYQRGNWFRKYSLHVYDQFKLDRIKYPAILHLTVKGIIPIASQLNCCKDENGNQKLETESNRKLKFVNIENSNHSKPTFLGRLPGQICKYPNMIQTTHLQQSSKGCLVSKFSPNGQFLAYSSNSDYNIQIATIPDLKVINTLRGHTNFVYDLDWLVDKRRNSFPLHLVSASSDRTAIVWRIEKDRVSLMILPHPSFLYAAKFVANLTEDECLCAVTGGRDCTIRLWNVTANNFELLQESIEHENYITSIVCSSKSSKFYSSDWNGCILEWGRENSNNYQVTRRLKLTGGIPVLNLHLHPKNEMRLYAQLKNNRINCLDISNEIVLNTLGTADDENTKYKFTISPCGSTIYTIQSDTILIHDILSGTLQSSIKVPCVKNPKNHLSHLDYHPNLFLLSATIYGINGGIVLLAHKSKTYSIDNHKEAGHQSFDNRWMLVRDNIVHSQSSELLGNIIQKIDDILHQPQLHKNETDDFKNRNIADFNRIVGELDCDYMGVNRTVAPVEFGSLEILSDNESASSVRSTGTFTIKNRSISDASNRTFTLSNNGGGLQVNQMHDGTYNIDEKNNSNNSDNSDDTTISETM